MPVKKTVFDFWLGADIDVGSTPTLDQITYYFLAAFWFLEQTNAGSLTLCRKKKNHLTRLQVNWFVRWRTI